MAHMPPIIRDIDGFHSVFFGVCDQSPGRIFTLLLTVEPWALNSGLLVTV